MIEPILAIIDRLISLAKGRIDDRRGLFTNHLEPLFNDLTAVHLDYRESFGDTIKLLKDNSVDDQTLKDRLTERQARLLHMRQKIRALISALDGSPNLPDEAKTFLTAITWYFIPATGDGRTLYDGGTRFMTLLDALRSLDEDPEVRERVIDWVSDVLSQTDRTWDRLLDEYAKARLALLK